MTERFRHPHEKTASIYEKIKRLLDILSTAETPSRFIADVQTWIDSIDDLKARDKKIEKHPVGVVFFKTPENAEHDGFPFQEYF